MEGGNERYMAVARRFRPQTFDALVGQEHIAQALTNAVRNQRTAHAYLFTGARGVGKTSAARILAKALNCPHVKDSVPCATCEICQAIANSEDLDVTEIDGASNRGIDDIRMLRSNVNVKSMRSPYKIYIIDEVHMLTKEAFNALLKTLEEPPANVRFVFCTTEPNKVPDTILSRCQRFDFAHIAESSIQQQLVHIAKSEGVGVTPEAIELVARRAAGSMRDSQSLLDQLLSFGADPVTPEDVHRLLGTAPDDRLANLLDAVIARDRKNSLELFESFLHEGAQIGNLVDQLVLYVRDLIVVGESAEVALASVSTSFRTKLVQQSQQWGVRTAVAALQILSETKSKMQRVTFDRALAEMAIIRLTLLGELDSIAAWMSGQPTAAPTKGALPRQIEAVQRNVMPARPTTTSRRQSPTAPAREEPNSDETSEANESDLPSHGSGQPENAPREESSIAHVEFSDGTKDEFFSQVLSRISDRISDHLRKGAAAISGPNLLEIVFPQSYAFSKNYCGRAECVQQIESCCLQIAGKPVRIELKLVESKGSEVALDRKPGKNSDLQRVRSSAVDRDPFVQEALSLFGGQLLEVRRVQKEQVATDPGDDISPSVDEIEEEQE